MIQLERRRTIWICYNLKQIREAIAFICHPAFWRLIRTICATYPLISTDSLKLTVKYPVPVSMPDQYVQFYLCIISDRYYRYDLVKRPIIAVPTRHTLSAIISSKSDPIKSDHTKKWSVHRSAFSALRKTSESVDIKVTSDDNGRLHVITFLVSLVWLTL